jgi:ADP-ribosylglycohydrolase
MSRAEADEHYHRYLGTYIPFEAFKQDMHRSRWQVGDWTDDTDQMILLMDGLFATNGSINATDFALRLKYWTRHGFVCCFMPACDYGFYELLQYSPTAH